MDGIKNFAWFSHDEQPMFNKIIPKRAMLRNTKYEDYDPAVFRQLVAFYTNGLRTGTVAAHELSDVSDKAAAAVR
jgi:large subunit ribosomal protein L37